MENETECLIKKKLEKLPNKTKLNLIISMVGQCGIMADFIAGNYDLANLPIMVKYAGFMTALQLRALTSQVDETEFTFCDKSQDYKIGEQTEERIYRIMNEIIDEFIAEREKELKKGL